MKLFSLTFIVIVTSMLLSCKSKDTDTQSSATNNPLLEPYNTPYGVPPFDKIKDEHYQPALEESMAMHKTEIDAIAHNEDAPTFENTIEALDKAGLVFSKVSNTFYNLSGAHTNDVINAVEQEMAPKIAQHFDYISLNEKLFERVNTVYEAQPSLNLNEEQTKLLNDTYKSFVRNGALLKGEDRETIAKINEDLSTLMVNFSQNVQNEVNNFEMWIDNEADLAGLPEGVKATAAEAAKNAGKEGQWLFGLQNPSVMPFLQYADNRDLRKKIWEGYSKKGANGNSNDNKNVVEKLINLRLQRANLLGYPNHAAYQIEERMAKTPQAVNDLLAQLWPPAMKKAQIEADEINAFIKKSGGNFSAEPYDWRYYAEKIRIEKYNLDENEIKQYFQLENVHKGVFGTVEKLFGLTFKERKDLPSYHPEATAYEVNDADSSLVGILYMDFHPRESKRGGAWMSSFSEQRMENGKRITPVITIVCNFTQPTGDMPALLTFDEVSTYFHEFGHALHGLLSNTTYRSQSGTNVPTDFVELPSMIMENWATEPEVLKMFATHYKTGELIPDALVQKIKNAGTYGQGFATAEYLASSLLDMGYHTMTTAWEGDPVTYEKDLMSQKGLLDEIIPRHSSTYFNHIFSNSYSAGYYSYIWSEVLDSDAFEVFKSKGIFDPATAQSFRKNILERGGTAEAMDLYKRFRGAEPQIAPLLKKRGLN